MKEFEYGLKVGRGSLVFTQRALRESLGPWSMILPHLDRLSARKELELVASIDYLLGKKDVELTPPLKAAIATDFVYSENKLVISDAEFLIGLQQGGGQSGQEREERQ